MKCKVHPTYKQLVIHVEGRVFSMNKGEFLKTNKSKKGYESITLCIGSRKSKKTRSRCVQIHHLVLETFVGPRPHGYHGAYLNGNSLDKCEKYEKALEIANKALHDRLVRVPEVEQALAEARARN